MRIRELRIGNYYNIEGSLGIVDKDIYKEKIYISIIKPIPISEEWLLSFGFKKNKKEEYFIRHYITNGIPLRIKWLQYDKAFYSNHAIIPIQFIHQLQNLYFALTGEELQIKK